MNNYIKTWIEMMGRFVIFTIGLFVLLQMGVSKLGEILACIIFLAWLFVPLIELVKKTKEVKK